MLRLYRLLELESSAGPAKYPAYFNARFRAAGFVFGQHSHDQIAQIDRYMGRKFTWRSRIFFTHPAVYFDRIVVFDSKRMLSGKQLIGDDTKSEHV